jgi:enoyl-[acyl-carrier protein] reductase III
MIDLTGKVALVTAAGRGIGRAVALRLAAAGADIVLNFRSDRSAAEVTAAAVADLGRRVGAVQADLTEPDDIRTMVAWVGEAFGQLDIVVSCTPTVEPGSLVDSRPEAFLQSLHTGARSLLLLTQAALPWLERSASPGKIVAVAPAAGASHSAASGLRGAGHSALEGTVKQLAAELGPRGLRINGVQAGLLEQHNHAEVISSGSPAASVARRPTTAIRQLTADDVADVVLFLASPLSDMVQGQTVLVDGGRVANVVRRESAA